MILQLISFILIQTVLGWRRYNDYYYGYRFGWDYYNKCPELHTFMPDMHPHQCVSYASICKDVTEVVVKTATNGTQYVCHPRFQPWGAGTPTKDTYSVHCGYQFGVFLVMEMLNDGHYKFYCQYNSHWILERCLIASIQYGQIKCLYCKRPFYGNGFSCDNIESYYDRRYTNPTRPCKYGCLECSEDQQNCGLCREGYVASTTYPGECNWLYGETYVDSKTCIPGYFWDSYSERCRGSFDPCYSPQSSPTFSYYPFYTCYQCFQGYFTGYVNRQSELIQCYQYDWNCGQYRQSIMSTYDSNDYYSYWTTCSLCDPGYIYRNDYKICYQIQNIISYCVLLDPQQINCIACYEGYALQSDGTCKQTYCDSECSTCLDTNPSYCTTCDVTENKIADNGICKCLPGSGYQEGNCKPCTEGYCQVCQLEDFYQCISCKVGSNRIVVNQQCICQTGYYDPQNEDQICLSCDISCVNCDGPTNQECTQCPEESISNRNQVNTSCPCKVGYGEYAIKEQKCGTCHPRCHTCFQAADLTSNQYCLTCIPGQNREVSETFKCDCQVNSGDLEGTLDVCIICHYTCGSCNGTEPINCIQCSEDSFRELTTSGECLCKLSYYDDETENIQCSKCHYSCITCANSTEKGACVQCPPTRKPNSLDSQFECICIDENTFDDGFSLECQQCDKNCQTCNGPLPSNCLTCDPKYRQMDLSSCICPIGYYDIGQLECSKCHYSCHQCFDNTSEGCIICSLELSLRVLKGNICKCIDGYYEEQGISQCKKCSYRCETCETNAEKCLTCPLNSLRMLDSVKGCFCPGEYYDKENEFICQRCHFKCKTCNGQDQNNCLTCDSLAYREFKANECKCQTHYFEMEVQECTACSALCYECTSNFEKCTSCNNDRYLVENTCKCVTKFNGGSISTFEYNGMIKCQKCHYSCGTCGGIEEGDCISCIDSDQRVQVGNTCVCKSGYFDAGLPVCEKCNYKCQACSKQSESCTSCLDNSFRQFVPGFNKCQCIQRYYDDGVNEVCQKCHYSCLRCNEIETKCELCSSESNRIYNDQLFSCDCNIGYYDIGVENCQKCHFSCLTCSSGDANSCISCVDMNTSNRVFYNKTCKCLFGYYDDGKSISCQKCDIQCLSCAQQSYLCQSCPQTRKIETNCKCQQGYYDVGLQLCQKCYINCLTCEISSNNCTSCDSNQFRELNLITQTCDCQLGYLDINGICEQCHSSCKTCSESINKCTSCVQFRNLKNNDCICNDGMYESSVDKLCKLCNKTCLSCANSNNYCLTCSIENFRQFNTGNTCECKPGYYEDPITQNCELCSSSCLTCSLQYDNCTSCDSSLHLSLLYNKCVCSQSYYYDPLTNQCEQCNIICLECQNGNECTECRLTTRHFDGDSKKCLCNHGYYETNQQNCQLCHLSCDTCQNVNTYCLTCSSEFKRILTNNTCLCIDGYYDAGIELCQKCNNLCKTCQSSASSCLSCYEIEHYRYYQGNKCLCKSGYYDQNTEICSKCSNECLTCQGSAEYCTSCDTNSKRLDQSIIHKCPCILGFYQDQNQICQKCHIKCQSCVNQRDQCLSCNFQLNSNRLPLSNQCDCKEGYFDDGKQFQCQPCNFKCKTCITEANNCLICQNLIRTQPPICNCMDGYYEDEQLICQSCASQCNTCILQPSNCLSCNPGRIEMDCRCIDGYFEIGQLLCSQCAFQCATCYLDPLNCKTCKGDRTQEPQCICQPGYFDDLLNEDCQLCDSTCLECNIIGCLSCSANRILNEEMDCIPPPNSIWYDDTPWCSTCQVAVVKAYLSDDISKIIISFDFPLNQKGFNSQIELNKCLQLFELESALSFGQNSVCYVNQDNDKELLISLGEYSTIKIGQEILFKSNSISHVNCETTLQKFIFATLQMPINPLPPSIEYCVPLHKLNPLADNSVYLKYIKNNGNRKLDNIVWSCQVETGKDSSALIQFLDQINLAQEYNLLIPKFTLPSIAELKFKVSYENFIQIKSYTEFSIKTNSGTPPQIYLNIKPSYLVYETIQFSVSADNLDQSISKDNTKFQIQVFEIDRSSKKSSSSQLNISGQAYPLEKIYANIKKYTLSPNSTYTFQVIATNLNTEEVQSENFTIDIPFAGLKCQFNNRGIQSIRRDLNLKIECRDLDTKYEWNNDQDLFVQVDCKDLSLNSSCQNEQKQIIKVNKTENFQFIKRNQISPFTVQEWTVNAKKFLQTSKFVLIIVYLDDDFPVLDLEFNQGYLIRKINNYEQLNFTFLIGEQRLYLLELSIAIVYNYEIIEILSPKYKSHQFKIFNSIQELNFGDNINLKFAAQYTNNIIPSQNNLKITINQPPQCSKLLITSSSDFALTDLVVTTKCEQSNDSPYRYQLKLFLRENDLTGFLQGKFDNSLTFYSFQNQNSFSIQIPTSVNSSKIGILIQVLDSGGSIANVFEMITTKPAKINCSSIQYQNMILQNKISLLFESMNQNCGELHHKIYLNLQQQLILPNQNDNYLKLQAIKLYKQFLNQLVSVKPQNRLLKEEISNMCYDLNTTHFVSTQQTVETNIDLTKKLEDLEQNILKLGNALKYFIKMKEQCIEEIQRNQFIWNEEIFEQYENSQEGLINLIYYIDDLYSIFSTVNSKNDTIYKSVNSLLNYIPLIVEEVQNKIHVNDKPIAIQGDEIIWQIKRTTKQFFNQQFKIETTQEDYLVEFLQYESTYLKSNPLRFMSDLEILLQKEFNDSTLKLFQEHYYQVKLKNVYNGRFNSLKDFPSKYSTKFGAYKNCTNDTQTQQSYEIQCVIRTFSGQFHKCNLNVLQNNDTFEQICECNKFGDIFLTTSTNFIQVMVNVTNQQLEVNNVIEQKDFWILIISSNTLTIIFIALYIFHKIKEYKNQSEIIETQQKNLNPVIKKSLTYQGNSLMFKQQFKNIHQTISLLYYKDNSIKLSYRILDVLSQINLLLTLAIYECFLQDNSIIFVCLFIIANPIAIFILRMIYKIFEAIYRFEGIAAFIIQLILIIFLMTPNLILILFYTSKMSIQSEQYLVGLIFIGNILISQVLLENLTIFGRIIIYRLIAYSLKNMELNPIYHLMHFFVIHSSLEEVFDEFTKI